MTATWCLRCGTYRHWAGACPIVDPQRRAARIRRAVTVAALAGALGQTHRQEEK